MEPEASHSDRVADKEEKGGLITREARRRHALPGAAIGFRCIQSWGMAMNDVTSTAPTDWAAPYQKLASEGSVPAAASQVIDQNHAVFQDMYLDLGVIANLLLTSGLTPPLVTIYADVLNIPETLNHDLQNAVMVIVARRIESGAQPRINLDYRTGTLTSLVLYTNELVGGISVVAAVEDGGVKAFPFMISVPPPGGGVQFLMQGGVPVEQPRSFAQGMAPVPPQTFQDALMASFIFASLFYDQRPDIALSIFTWVKDWSSASPALLDFFLRSSSMVTLLSAQINAQQNGACLRAVSYQGDLHRPSQGLCRPGAGLRDQLPRAQHAGNHRRQRDQARADPARQPGAAERLRRQAAGAGAIELQQRRRLGQRRAEPFRRRARHHGRGRDRLQGQGHSRMGAQEDPRGDNYAATAIVTFGVGIAGMLVGDEAAGAASAEAAVEGAKAAEAAAKAGSEIAKMAKTLADEMKQLKKVIEGLKKVYELSKAVIEAAQDINGAKSSMGLDAGDRRIDRRRRPVGHL